MTVATVAYPGQTPTDLVDSGSTRPDQLHRKGRRGRIVDAWCLLLTVIFVAITIVDGLTRHLPPVPLATDAVLGALCGLGLLLRRRWPVGLAVTVGLLSIYSRSASGVGLIALFTVAVHRRLPVAVPVAVGYALTTLLTPLVRPDLSGHDGREILLDIACTTAALAWGMFVRARRLLAASQRERARRAESEQELRIAQVRQLERNRIAREMHDVLAHRISLLSLHAGALELRPDAPPAEIARAAAVIRDSAHRALEDLREVIGVLRAGRADDDVPEPPQPTLVDLPVLIDESRHCGTRVVLDCRVADPAAVPAATGRTVYRIVQEGLTNARKHAPDAEVSVTLQAAAGHGLTVEIRNPAPAGAPATLAFPAIPGAGTGIVGLAERASLAGGRLEHGHTPTGDFRLWAWLPWTT